jgi:hypothetical protein
MKLNSLIFLRKLRGDAAFVVKPVKVKHAFSIARNHLFFIIPT